MNLVFAPIDEHAAREIVKWRYDPPYDVYNLEDSETSIEYALDPQNNFYAMHMEDGQLAGFCSFGRDWQVPGGDYTANALDIGMGIRPDLTGRGQGADFVLAVLDYAWDAFAPRQFRVTIAAFNKRAQRVWKKNGFIPIQTFTFHANQREFIIMTRDANMGRNRHIY